MAKVKVLADSSADLTDELYNQYGISVVPFQITFDKKTFYRERVDITTAEFYERLKGKNVFPSTSLPSTSDYETAFRPHLENGFDIVCVCLSSKLSGSYQSAVSAVNDLAVEFPDREICAIDSVQAACAEGLLAIHAARMAGAGAGAQEIVKSVEAIKWGARVFFTLDSLEYLQKGGRVGKASALAGSILNIKPIIVMKDAELLPVSKIRGRQKALDKVVALVEEYVGAEKGAYEYILINSECRGEALLVLEKMRGKGFKVDYPVMDLGACIGSHTGPSLIGVALAKKEP